jgi:asparagine synthetase B (glutamine-hydrolysing)
VGERRRDSDKRWAASVTQRLGLRHKTIEFSPAGLQSAALGAIFRQFDEPTDTVSRAITQHVISQVAAEAGIESCLSGRDAEYLVGRLESWEAAKPLLEAGSSTGEVLRSLYEDGRYFSAVDLQRAMVEPPADTAGLLAEFVGGIRDRAPTDDFFELQSSAFYLRAPAGRYGRFSELIPPLSGVETRSAFRDRKLFEFARSIPSRFKGSESKDMSRLLLKQAFAGRLPELIEREDKSAFPGAPGEIQQAPGLRGAILQAAGRAKTSGYFHPRFIDGLVRKQAERPHSRAAGCLWVVFAFQVWHDLYVERCDPFESLAV